MFGITFAIKLMEGVEKRAQSYDKALVGKIPEIQTILTNEETHERELIALIDEERLKYVGSVVLGLNDALVEFTGTLAGLTFAIQNTQIIAVVGLIMGVAASLSMGASDYLSQRSDGGPTDPVKGISVYRCCLYRNCCPAYPAISNFYQPVLCSDAYPARCCNGNIPVYVLPIRGQGSSFLETLC